MQRQFCFPQFQGVWNRSREIPCETLVGQGEEGKGGRNNAEESSYRQWGWYRGRNLIVRLDPNIGKSRLDLVHAVESLRFM